MLRPRRLHPWLASLVGLGWLLGLALPGAHAGAFRVAETHPRDPRAAALAGRGMALPIKESSDAR